MASQGESTVSFDRATPCAVHWLPCDLQYTGKAPVSQYFGPQPAEAECCRADDDGAQPLQAAFRGRQLRGARMRLPPGFEGFVLRKPWADANAARIWKTDACTSELTYWNHDTPPSGSDHAQRSFEWLALSSAVHSTVSAEQVEAKMRRASLQ